MWVGLLKQGFRLKWNDDKTSACMRQELDHQHTDKAQTLAK